MKRIYAFVFESASRYYLRQAEGDTKELALEALYAKEMLLKTECKIFIWSSIEIEQPIISSKPPKTTKAA